MCILFYKPHIWENSFSGFIVGIRSDVSLDGLKGVIQESFTYIYDICWKFVIKLSIKVSN